VETALIIILLVLITLQSIVVFIRFAKDATKVSSFSFFSSVVVIGCVIIFTTLWCINHVALQIVW
jgi:hypothetical protein